MDTSLTSDDPNKDNSTLDSVYHTDDSDKTHILEHHKESEKQNIDSGHKIKHYIKDLTPKEDSILGQTVLQFIACTKDSPTDDPTLIMRNMRQVMNGLKNYLIITGEGELFQLLKLERAKLSPDQFLDLDMILEEAMQNLIVRPLREHLELILKSLVDICRNSLTRMREAF